MRNDLTEGSTLSTVLKTSWPLIVAFTLQSAFNVVDAFFVGKISAEALAAVSVSFPVVFLIISLGTGVGAGATSVVARFIGAKEYQRADNAAEHAIIAGAVLGIVLGGLGILAAPTIFGFMGAEGTLKSTAIGYLNILLIFAPFMMVAFVLNSIVRGEGDMKTPMKVMGFAAILNMVLDPVFIFVFGWGVRGAAFATAAARFVAMSILLYHILSGRSSIKLCFKHFRYRFEYVKRIFEVGLPSSLTNVTMSAGMFILTTIVGFYGVDALAAFGVGFRLDGLAILPGLGIMTAVISMVGQNIGAGKVERARLVTLKAGLLACALMSCLGVLFYLFAPQIVGLFNTDAQVVAYGVSFLRIVPFTYLVVGMAMAMSGAFIGAGKAVYAFIATAFRVIVFSAPLAYLISQSMGVTGIWIGWGMGSFLGFAVSVLLFKYGKWEESTA